MNITVRNQVSPLPPHLAQEIEDLRLEAAQHGDLEAAAIAARAFAGDRRALSELAEILDREVE